MQSAHESLETMTYPNRLAPGTLAAVFALLLAAAIPAAGLAQEYPAARAVTGDAVSVRGLMVARFQAVLSSQISARIARLPFREGERFKKGDTLVEFDCAFFQAQLEGAKAELKAARLRLENNQQLARLRSVGRLELALSRTEVDRQRADVKTKQVVVDRCRIKAPFDGRVAGVAVNAHEHVADNTELLSALGDTSLEVKLIVPSSWLVWLKPGMDFSFAIDETGNELRATVTRLGAQIDPVSQTLAVFADVVSPTADLIAGMSGTARFERGPPS